MITLRQLDLSSATTSELAAVVRRSAVPDPSVRRRAAEIVDEIRTGGDSALQAAAQRYGGSPADSSLRIDPDVLRSAWRTAPQALREALERAARNIRVAHEPQRPSDMELEVVPGVRVDRRWQPLNRIGVYVPGGKAPYPSSLLMGAVPAQVAGVGEIAVATPADSDGNVSPAILAAAGMLGVDEMYAMGGAQAIAALAHGTETIVAVDKIVGPGSAWVTAAKLAVYGDCAVDLPAGPSEALVVADETAAARIVAADLLCQAEHGPDSPVVLVTTSRRLADDVCAQLLALLPALERNEILAKALGDHGLIVHAADLDAAVSFANRYAPEHLSVHTADATAVAKRLTAAGSVFVGRWSPESAGDYATGANHVLPTGGLAGSYGPLSVEDFGSWRQVQELTEAGLASLRPTIAALAEAEGLTAHRLAADIRFESRP
ncbi:MAG TPA: histidinol dehydrogenase [Acidimicrobiia bacterium]|nr:histidinol dehydrogenase [Acidimicrobiia bacterium]